MKYDITKQTAPKMPNLGRGTECIRLLISQASKDMHEPLVPMFFPSLGAHVSGAEFQYPDLTWQEPTGLMANLVADSGCNKGQLSYLVEANCRDFRLHDKGEMAKIDAWQRLPKTNDKPARPETALFFPPADCTRAAFIQNALALEKFGGRTQYLNMPEVEMADGLCGGHKQVSHMLRNIYDVKSPQPRSSPTATRSNSQFSALSSQLNTTCSPTAMSPANGSSYSCRRCCPRWCIIICLQAARTSATTISSRMGKHLTTVHEREALAIHPLSKPGVQIG